MKIPSAFRGSIVVYALLAVLPAVTLFFCLEIRCEMCLEKKRHLEEKRLMLEQYFRRAVEVIAAARREHEEAMGQMRVIEKDAGRQRATVVRMLSTLKDETDRRVNAITALNRVNKYHVRTIGDLIKLKESESLTEADKRWIESVINEYEELVKELVLYKAR